ncbi:hypothetical protein SALBM217S_09553 [Streptomyces griseoloalbus]
MTSVTEARRSEPRAPDPSRPARRAVDHGPWFLVLPALIPILVLSVGPLLYGILLSFTDAQSGRTEPTRWIGTLNFQDLLQDTLFWESFRIGLVWAVGVTVPQFLLALGLADFAYGGHLADLTELLPKRLTSDIPPLAWQSVTFGDGVYGVPFLQEPRVLIADAARLRESGVRVPTPEHPWSWAEFRQVTKELSGDGRYGVAWPLKEPVSATLNLSLSAGGRLFHRDADGKLTVRFEEGDEVVPRTVHEQVSTDHSASPTTLGSGGSDTLPGLFAGTYAMVPLGFSYRQQIVQQAPKDFEWQVLPAPAGAGGLAQGVSPQTLSVAEDCPHKKEAVAFLDFLLRPRNMVRLALGDWMLPTGRQALADPALRTPEHGWATGTALAAHLRPAPAQSVRGYPEWKDKVATPALQEYYSGAIGLGELRERLEEDGNLVLARYQR